MKAIIEEPAAKPSRPSVRLMALVHAVIRKFTQITNSTMATTRPANSKLKNGFSMKLMPAWALGKPDLVGRISASTAYMVARMNCPMNLPLTVSPSLCFLRTFAKSSMNPKNPIDSIANSTKTADHDGTSPLVRNRYSAEEHQPSTTARLMTTPPSVGVPRLTRCDFGPS